MLYFECRKTDSVRFCCLASHVKNCLPQPDEFSSCEDLMSNHVLRICIWVLGLVSLVGNSVVIVWRLRDSRDSKVSTMNFAAAYCYYFLHASLTSFKLSMSIACFKCTRLYVTRATLKRTLIIRQVIYCCFVSFCCA